MADADSKPVRSPKSHLGDAVLRSLDKQPHFSSREMSKALCSLKTTTLHTLHTLHDLGVQFCTPRWISHRLPQEKELNRKELCRETLDFLRDIGPRQQQHLITGDES
jgi:hypothetical protein